MTNVDRAIHKVLLGAMGVISIGFLYALGLLVWPYNVADVDNPVVPAVVTRGVQSSMTIYACKHLAIPGDVVLTLVDGNSYTLFSQRTNNKVGCQTTNKTFTVPDSIPPGTYKINWNIAYHVNHLKDVTITRQSNEFQLK